MKIKTKEGSILKELYISDLGFLMGKFFNPKTKMTINEKLSDLNEILKNYRVIK